MQPVSFNVCGRFYFFGFLILQIFLKYGLYGRVSIPRRCVRFLTSWKTWTPPTFFLCPLCTDRPCALRLNLHNFIQLHVQFQAYWRGAKPMNLTFSNLKKVRMEKEWINWDLNLNLTTANMDQRRQLFERIPYVPHSAWGNVCWYMHYKIYSQ